MSDNNKKSRGLGALLARTSASTVTPQDDTAIPDGAQLVEIPVDKIVPSPRQPRRIFDKEALEELAASIRQHGLLQPVVVRQVGENYELIAGERRWRATKMAGKDTITAVSKPADNTQSLTMSIIENLQREDLDPIEEATAYRTLITELSLTQEQVAGHVGKERSTISNALRLLDLPLGIQAKLQSGSLSPGHARVLLAVIDAESQRSLAERAADKGMSVRELERLVYGGEESENTPLPTPLGAEPSKTGMKPAHIRDLEGRLAAKLGTKVSLKEGRRGGKLVISFTNDQEFLRILDVLGINSTEV